jgi:hypothetical protein
VGLAGRIISFLTFEMQRLKPLSNPASYGIAEAMFDTNRSRSDFR